MFSNRKGKIVLTFKGFILIVFTCLLTPFYAVGQENIDINIGTYGDYLFTDEDSWYMFRIGCERGFLDVLEHTIQYGKEGSLFDYVSEGGQDILFPFTRYTAELEFDRRHILTFLIQPFDIKTKSLLARDVTLDNLVFPEGTSMELRYYFTFYRLSYLYDFRREIDSEFAFGLSFQIRNASIVFASSDGELLRASSDVGPVPILKFRWKRPFENGLWIGSEIDGFYASGKYITGSTNDFEGAILDASVRIGLNLRKNFDTFLNVRYLGGGASGTQEDVSGQGDGYTDNWLKTLSVSLGFYLR